MPEEKSKEEQALPPSMLPGTNYKDYCGYYFSSDCPLTVRTFGYSKRNNRKNIINHTTSKYAFHYILSGSGFFNGLCFEEGDILYCSKNTPYSIAPANDVGCVYAYMTFSGGKSDRYVQHLGIADSFKVYRCRHMPEITEIFYDIIEHSYDDIDKDLYLESALIRLLSYSKPQESKNDEFKSKYSPIIEFAIKFISQNYNKADLRVEDIAVASKISEQHLYKKFKDEVGTTVYQFLTSLRMSAATVMLTASNYNINEIANIVGYNDRQNFNIIFKKRYGMSPTEYRKKCQYEE